MLGVGLPTLIYPFGRDQGTLAYIGSAILRGQVPHRDTWDQKPPGVPYLYALAFLMLGKSMEAIRAFDLLYQLLTVLLLFKLAETLYRASLAFLAGLFYGISYFIENNYFSMAHVDGFLNLPLIAAVYACYLGRRRRNKALLLLGGCLSSLAFTMKYPALFVLIGLGLYLGGEGSSDPAAGGQKREGRLSPAAYLKERVTNPGLLLAGFFLGLLPPALYLLRKGALYNLLETQWVFNSGYTRLAFQGGLLEFFSTVLIQLNRYLYYKAFFSVLMVAALVYGFTHRTSENRLTLVWFFSSLLGVIAQAKFYYYHWMLLLAPLSVLSAVGFDRLFQGLRLGASWLKNEFKVFALVTLFILILPTVNSYRSMARTFVDLLRGTLRVEDYYDRFNTPQGDFSLRTILAVVDYLQQKTTRQDAVYIWGFEPLINFLADRPIPTRYTYNVPLVAPWGKPSWREELIEDLKRSPPRYMMVAEKDAIPWTTGRTEDSKRLLEEFPDLKTFLRENYREEKQIGPFTLYRRKI